MTTHIVETGVDPLIVCAALQSGDTVLMKPGVYPGGFLGVKTGLKNIAIRAHLDYPKDMPIFVQDKASPVSHFGNKWPGFDGKGFCVVKGEDVTVERITFTGNKNGSGNGAGIRHEGANLTVLSCLFDGNQAGILGSNDVGWLRIENNTFTRNGKAGYAHQIYNADLQKLVVLNNNFNDGQGGHEIKTRARLNIIAGNRIDDEDGDASYGIDISGGEAYIVGNEIKKGPDSSNVGTMINFYCTRDPVGPHKLVVRENLLVSLLRTRGCFVRARGEYIDAAGVPQIAPVSGKIDSNTILTRGYWRIDKRTGKVSAETLNYAFKPFEIPPTIILGQNNVDQWAPLPLTLTTAADEAAFIQRMG